MEMNLRRETRQQQSLTPRLQRAVRLLQLSSLEFAQELQQSILDNPFLENEEADGDEDVNAEVPGKLPQDHGDTGEPAALESAGGEAFDAEPAGSVDEKDDYNSDEYGSPEPETAPVELPGSHNNDHGDDSNFTDLLPYESSLQEILHRQLNVLALPDRDLVLAKAIVESLDDDGYLRIDLDELADLVDFQPPASEDELRIALRRVQALEPAGVGARSVSECLQLQLADIPCPIAGELARTIVADHLDLLVAKDIPGLARALDTDRSAVELACASIRRLQPRPGWQHTATASRFITPDVIVRKVRGSWTASLNPGIVPKVRMNHVYAEMFRRHRAAQHAELAAHLQEARWTMRTIEQRFATILSVAQSILRRQHQFLDFGPMAMKPLGLREIAEELGLHESTVSRVTNNKFMATPLGTFELKYFFSRGMKTANGGACSPTAIRGLVKDMIESERATERLSDAEIARRLARQGLAVARRTVTKYRQSLHLETADLRARGN